MNKLLANFLLLICYGSLLLSQPTHALRIKRADSLANATINNNKNNNNLKANLTESPLPLAPVPGTATAAVAEKPQVKIMDTTQAAVPNGIVATAAAAAAAKATTAAALAGPAKKLDQLVDEGQANELAGHMHRAKRRMSLIDELPKAAHRARHHNGGGGAGGAGGVAAPPFVYFNKMVSPDGKQELKEFQLLAPNVVIESVQHDMNYAPNGELGGVLLLNADNNLNGRIHGLAKPKQHHHKHKSSLALPPFLFMLQQMLQPNLNMDLEMPQTQQRNRLDSPLYQFIDSAVDNALRNNHEIFEHEIELNDKDDRKDKEREINELMALSKMELNKDDKAKDSIEVPTNRKDDELVVTCPIHHEHHANNNGEIVDDDVVLVNECHIV